MTQTGFYAQKRNSPTSLALVVLLHAGVLAAVIMIKGPQFLIEPPTRTIAYTYPIEQDPPPNPPPPERQQQRPQPPTWTPPIVQTQTTTQTITTTRDPTPIQITRVELPPPPTITPDPPAAPVRRAAELDPRFAGELQPPYPAGEIRAQREGTVRIRITIGPDGRVKAVARVQATNDAFWAAAERQALNRWRFRPATLGGRPVEDSKVMILHFRLVDL